MPESNPFGQLVFGRLSWQSIPHDPIVLASLVMVVLGGAALAVVMTRYRAWGPLWRDWITSIDHKKIGIMYMVLGLVMLLRGFADALHDARCTRRSPSATTPASCRRTTTTRSSPPTA